MSAYQQYEKCQSSNGCTRASWGDCIDNIFVEIKDFNNAVFPACEILGYFITMPHYDGEIWENTLTFSIDGKN